MLQYRERYVEALVQEAKQRREFLWGVNTHLTAGGTPAYPQSAIVKTIYFGGGTPSLLTVAQIERVLEAIRENYIVKETAEITVEVNPSDVTTDYLRGLRQIGVNRLSIGIQTFSDERLQLIGRRHTAAKGIEAVRSAREAGFENISIDLMYGIPNETETEWSEDLKQAIELGVEHISAYCLTAEEGTPYYMMLERGELQEVSEDEQNKMYELAIKKLGEAGYEHYEVSNYSKTERESQHNNSYWKGTPYLGLGAGAHSYDGHKRREWNVSDIKKYIEGAAIEGEDLSDWDVYNERIMLGLRTKEGVDLSKLSEEEREYCYSHIAAGETPAYPQISRKRDACVPTEWLEVSENRLRIKDVRGEEMLDEIVRQLMRIKN